MPTFERTPQFLKDLKRLDSESLERFRRVVLEQFVPDVDRGVFRKTLRVKRVAGTPKGVIIYEMTWAHDGRATFQYGEEIIEGVPHVVWRRVGTHSRLNIQPGLNGRFRG